MRFAERPQHPKEELELAVSLINRVVEGHKHPLPGVPATGTRTGVHVCRGNWSTREEVLLRGPYESLLPYLERMNVDQLVLEYATSRAGDLADMSGTTKELGLGVVNPRTPDVEKPEAIVERVREAMRYLPAERIFLNPDCGFGTFAGRPMNSPETAAAKLASMAQARVLLQNRGP